MEHPKGSHLPSARVLDAQGRLAGTPHLLTHRCASHKAAVSQDQLVGRADVLE